MVWEKGGSGLVFYTDASYWDQQDGGLHETACGAPFAPMMIIPFTDFDEKCSKEDDWDVDMSTYYDYRKCKHNKYICNAYIG